MYSVHHHVTDPLQSHETWEIMDEGEKAISSLIVLLARKPAASIPRVSNSIKTASRVKAMV
jgi:hypothetical protein